MKEEKDSDAYDDLSRPVNGKERNRDTKSSRVKPSILVQNRKANQTPVEDHRSNLLTRLPSDDVPCKKQREIGNVCPLVILVEKGMTLDGRMKGEYQFAHFPKVYGAGMD